MESNDVFETEAHVDAINEARARQTKRPEVSTSAHGETNSLEQGTGENQPLLGQSTNKSYGNATVTEESDGGDDREDPTWLGARNFEGLPWWRTPSVGFNNFELSELCLRSLH